MAMTDAQLKRLVQNHLSGDGTALDLGWQDLGGDDLRRLVPLLVDQTGLQRLSFWRTPITDAGLVHLAQLTGLRVLVLWGTQITDAGLAHVAQLTDLQVLDLGRTQITDAGLAGIRAALPGCTVYV